MADSSNTEVDSQVDESTESETTSNSNEDLSGGFDSSALSDESLSVDSTPDFGIDFGSNNNSDSFDFSYNPFDDSGSDFGDALFGDSGSSETSEDDSKSEPTMTVDEVYGKGNQSIVEDQGDYAASSNEKSNVETSTLGKQDEISVTPTSVAENKGLVNNNTIQSVEGLDFQQKDKESQDVLEAKKNRDEVEAEDKANQMKDSLLANTGKPIGKQGEGDASKFQLGKEIDFDKQDKDKLNELNKQKQELDAANTKANQLRDSLKQNTEAWEDFKKEVEAKIQNAQDVKEAARDLTGVLASLTETPVKTFFNRSEVNEMKSKIVEDAKNYGLNLDPKGNVQVIARQYADAVNAKCDKDIEEASNSLKNKAKEIAALQKEYTDASLAQQEAQSTYNKTEEAYNTWKAEYWAGVEKTKAEEAKAKEKAPEVAPKTNAVTPEAKTKATENTPSKAEASIQAAREALKSSDLSPEQQAQAEQMLSDIEASRQAVIEASSKLTNNLEEVNPADIKTFIDKTDQYLKILEDDLKGNPFTKTDFNRTFTKAIADAIDLGEITLADGTKTTYSQLSTDMATKSPEVAKAMYEAKAQKYTEDGHPILAKIERAKAAMVGNWFGSKLTLADNQVRNQFNQMAKTNMRATYATYNNVLKDTTGKYSDADKAEASAAIKQANALMTASAALQASTGFWSGIGDSMKDGVYGTTNPKDLNVNQKILNAVDNLAKIVLGLGVTPAANKAYQNMYYMAGAKVDESGLYSKDFDGDGFALCQEYGNNAAAGMIAGAGELATGVVLVFNPSTVANGIDLIVDSIKTFTDGLYGVQKEARKSEKYTKEVLEYFEEAKDIVAETGNKEAADTIDNAITRIENFELKSDEVGNLNNWLEGSGSNTADNGKFNQALTYDEWLKLIEADPTMRDYAKKLIAEKKSE